MSNLKMNCGYCGRKCSLDKDFCIPQDSVYICKSCYNWKQKIKDLEAKLAESEKKTRTYAKEIVFLDKKLENLNKEFELAQEHNEKTVEYWQNEYSQLKQQCKECKHLNKKIELNIKNKLMNEIQQLKQQLAEKENEIEELKKGVYKVTLGTTPSNQIDFTENFYVIQNQTAIAELEKLRNYLPNIALDIADMVSYRYLKKQIDQQIKELKGEK